MSSTTMRARSLCLLLVLAACACWAPAASAKLEIVSTEASVTTPGGGLPIAGAHPESAKVSYVLKRLPLAPAGGAIVDGSFKDVVVDTPPGLVGNPRAIALCPRIELARNGCPAGSQVGVVELTKTSTRAGGETLTTIGVYNIVPRKGVVAELGFVVSGVPIAIAASVPNDDDHAIRTIVSNSSQAGRFAAVRLVLWGVPADPSHDLYRGTGYYCPFAFDSEFCTNPDYVPFWFGGNKANLEPAAFLTNPTACGGPLTTTFNINSWLTPEVWETASSSSPAPVNCDAVPFDPALVARPTTAAADAPSGLDVELSFPQDGLSSSVGVATGHLRDAVVTLPEGMTINPGSAEGLQVCTDEQLRLKSDGPASCLEGSKLGTVTATTPVLEEPIEGSVYLRPQASDDPASGDMFRLAFDLENEERGLSVRLAGSVKVDPATGRIQTVFADNPQLPISKLSVRLKSGPRAPLATSASCGSSTVTAKLTSWSGKAADLADSSPVDCAPGLGSFAPAFKAGTVVTTGGAFTSFALGIRKPDGQSPLTGLTVEMPTGLLASLKGNLNTQVGTVRAFAGPGSSPYVLPGKVFLEGPYGGAPFSLRVVVPAKAGPFDLGEVVVRQKVYVDPIDAHVTVVSDPVPTIVKGVPTRLQRLDVDVDKPGFMINPTSCAAKTVAGTLSSATGQTAAVSNRFQARECGSLDLEPKLALSLSGKGQTRDGGHPAVSASLTQPGGQANLKKVRVALPLSLALDPENSDSDAMCSFVEGSKPDPKCPASSVVGKATAVSPILNEPLSGPVFFVKNERKDPKSGRSIKTTPKLVIPLVGENGVKLTLTGTSDVVDDKLITTFDTIPDAPVSSFKMDIAGGKKGILVVSDADICKSTPIAEQEVDGQNNADADADVAIQTPSCPLKVLSKKVGKSSVAVKVGGLGAGKVTVTGKGIKKTSKTIGKSTVATITARRTKGKPGKVTVSFDPVGPAKARKTTK